MLNELKKIDEGNQIDYLEAGLSMHRGVYKVPQDDLQLYLCKVFEDTLPIVDECDQDSSHQRRFNRSNSSLSESSDNDGAVKGSSFFKNQYN